MKVCLKCEHVFSADGWTCPSCSHAPLHLLGIDAHAPALAGGGGGFEPEYFSVLAGLEAGNFWFRARNELILWALRTYKPDAQSFLEVGCGTGFVLSGVAKAYPEIALSGSEIFLAGLSHAAERVPSARFMQMDARHVPFENEFDVIGAFDVLEHIAEDETVLAQLHRALKPGGVLLLTVPQHAWLWSPSDDYARHERRYSAKEIHQKLDASGFGIMRSTSFVSLLLPLMLASRWRSNSQQTQYNPEDEFRMSPMLNGMLYRIMSVERRLIQAGLNFPAGGSRLILAQKLERD